MSALSMWAAAFAGALALAALASLGANGRRSGAVLSLAAAGALGATAMAGAGAVQASAATALGAAAFALAGFGAAGFRSARERKPHLGAVALGGLALLAWAALVVGPPGVPTQTLAQPLAGLEIVLAVAVAAVAGVGLRLALGLGERAVAGDADE